MSLTYAFNNGNESEPAHRKSRFGASCCLFSFRDRGLIFAHNLKVEAMELKAGQKTETKSWLSP